MKETQALRSAGPSQKSTSAFDQLGGLKRSHNHEEGPFPQQTVYFNPGLSTMVKIINNLCKDPRIVPGTQMLSKLGISVMHRWEVH